MKILNMLLEYSSCFSALLFKHSQKFYLCFKYELFAYKILTKKLNILFFHSTKEIIFSLLLFPEDISFRHLGPKLFKIA